MKRDAWLAILVGWALSLAFAFFAVYLLAFMASRSGVQGRNVAYILSFLMGPLGCFLGGLECAYLSRNLTVHKGILIGLLALLVQVIRFFPFSNEIRPILFISWLFLPIAGALGGWLGGQRWKPGDTPEAAQPKWLVGAVVGMGAFLIIGGLLLLFSVKNEAGFVYIAGNTTIGYITQAVLLLGYLVGPVIQSSAFWPSDYAGIVFMLIISGLPWAVCGGLYSSGRKKWAYVLAIIIILGSVIPGVLFWLIAKGLSEGQPVPTQ
jgi:hypothetical protein